MMLLAGVIANLQLQLMLAVQPSSGEGEVTLPRQNPDDWVMFSKDTAYFRECVKHFKMNHTWGKIHAPFVDKVEAKEIVKRARVTGLDVIPTLALLDKKNISQYSLELMKSLKQPYIIKSTHMSGGVARVFNNRYHCFKYCDYGTSEMPLGTKAFEVSKSQFTMDIGLDYSRNGGELQYRYIKPQVIFEEDIRSRTATDVTFWWVSGGHPVFVSQQCEQPAGNKQGFQMKRVFLSTDYVRLPIVFNRGVCGDAPPKPASWERQFQIARALGKLFPDETVRVDLYDGKDGKVFFSEFTFTTAGCWRTFSPTLADGLLWALAHHELPPAVASPTYIQRVLTDRSWVLLSLDEEGFLIRNASSGHPSPVDMCSTLESFGSDNKSKQRLFDKCISNARDVKGSALRCLVYRGTDQDMIAFGVDRASQDVASRGNLNLCEKNLPARR